MKRWNCHPWWVSLGLMGMVSFGGMMPGDAHAEKQAWRNHVYIRPSGGANVFTPEEGDPVTVISVGGVAGINYWETGRQLPKMRGTARLAGAYVMGGTNVSGYEVRLGNFAGPLWKTVGFTVGPDFFYNQYQYGDTTIPGTGGMGVPLTGDAYLDNLSFFAGVEPAWYFNEDRARRDWSEASGPPGFGHEFAYFAGTGVQMGGLNVSVSWRYSMTAYGEQNSFGFGASFDGEIGGKKKKGGKGGRRR